MKIELIKYNLDSIKQWIAKKILKNRKNKMNNRLYDLRKKRKKNNDIIYINNDNLSIGKMNNFLMITINF